MKLDTAWLAVIIPVAIAAGTGLASFLTSRRTASGVIRTSDADVLWNQSQKMMEALQRDKDRAEDQRDRLLDLQEHQIMPALEALSATQQHVLGLLTELVGLREKGMGK